MHFTESLQIDAPPETVFAAINDYGRRLEWDTLLRTAEVLSVDGHIVNCSTPIVPGMRVRSYARWLAGGVVMDTRYVVCEFPAATIEMVAGPWFFHSFRATSRVERTRDGGTKWSGEYDFQSQPGWLRSVVEPIITWKFRRETEMRVAGLKQWLEANAE